MIRRSASQPRSAFTLIELLIAIAIIALLAALLLPAISKVRTFANRATATSEMNQLAAATTKFQSDWGFYPPSSMLVIDPATNAQTVVAFRIPSVVPPPAPANLLQAQEKACFELYKTRYPRWLANAAPGAPTGLVGAGATLGTGYVLNGNQSLVYFLSGPSAAFNNGAGLGWAADAPVSPTGTTSMLYYTFQSSRLVTGTTFAYSVAQVYMDPFGSPYAYFGSNKVGGKYNDPDSMTFNLTTVHPIRETATRFINEKTCQIICAGETGSDGLDGSAAYSRGFGVGGIWMPGTGDYSSGGNGGDDFGNFNGGAPMSRRGE